MLQTQQIDLEDPHHRVGGLLTVNAVDPRMMNRISKFHIPATHFQTSGRGPKEVHQLR